MSKSVSFSHPTGYIGNLAKFIVIWVLINFYSHCSFIKHINECKGWKRNIFYETVQISYLFFNCQFFFSLLYAFNVWVCVFVGVERGSCFVWHLDFVFALGLILLSPFHSPTPTDSHQHTESFKLNNVVKLSTTKLRPINSTWDNK